MLCVELWDLVDPNLKITIDFVVLCGPRRRISAVPRQEGYTATRDLVGRNSNAHASTSASASASELNVQGLPQSTLCSIPFPRLYMCNSLSRRPSDIHETLTRLTSLQTGIA
jgi:hypothetical protein